MVLSGLIFYKSSSPPVLLLAAVLGVISPVANEVSPYQAVDIAVLSQLVPDKTRVQIFTSYMFAGAISSAIGGVVTGAVIHHYLPLVGASEAYRRVFLVFSVSSVCLAVCEKMLIDLRRPVDCSLCSLPLQSPPKPIYLTKRPLPRNLHQMRTAHSYLISQQINLSPMFHHCKMSRSLLHDLASL